VPPGTQSTVLMLVLAAPNLEWQCCFRLWLMLVVLAAALTLCRLFAAAGLADTAS
jgi:hypothetical protein